MAAPTLTKAELARRLKAAVDWHQREAHRCLRETNRHETAARRAVRALHDLTGGPGGGSAA